MGLDQTTLEWMLLVAAGWAAFLIYMVIGLWLLLAYQHRYPDWLYRLANHRNDFLFVLHWALWPLVCGVLLFCKQRRPRQPQGLA